MKLDIFFPCFAGDPDEYTDDNPFNLNAVKRDIVSDHPIRNAMLQMIAGPTDAEFDQGVAPVDTARINLNGVSVHQGACTISLKFRTGFSSYVSELSELALTASISRTLLAFPDVTSVSVVTA